ncbi:hypothetical protein GYMLUDRAFT_242389 [Collybiopsis luxurians FD-317 M1]|uniref:Uncharacterized protein n=1 Tax=Collybiopsis luxurians FD-317 M1 TaxID=944289 RepID=A0A0D0BFQ4_9AGAR|nr:hypothetical protein GYMLUDRAFT_242389 [Collybiopsis luxurians FD-317 M1]
MKFALLISLAAAGSVSASAVCVVCSRTIFYAGATRTLTSGKEEGSNTLQCNYDTPPISGLNPYCYYANINGSLLLSNTGGACPDPGTRVTQPGPACTFTYVFPISLSPTPYLSSFEPYS